MAAWRCRENSRWSMEGHAVAMEVSCSCEVMIVGDDDEDDR